MDCDAVLAADNKTLIDMGIATKGDMLALRAFCEKKKGKKQLQSREKGRKQNWPPCLK